VSPSQHHLEFLDLSPSYGREGLIYRNAVGIAAANV